MSERQDLAKFKKFCSSKFGQVVMQKEAEFLARELQGCSKVLDVGCGIGAHEKLLPEFDITGVDKSELFVRYAAGQNNQRNKRFAQGDAAKLEFPDNSFDAVFSVATVEFIEKYQTALREMARVLKKGRKMILMILNPQSAYFQEHIRQEGSYFRGVKHRNLERIRLDCVPVLKMPRHQYFLGIKGKQIFATDSPDWAALYVITGEKI